MSSPKHARIPNRPVLFTTTTRVVSGKAVKTTTPLPSSPKNTTKKSSSNSHSEVPAIHQIPQREKQEDTKFNLKKEQLIDSSHSPRGSYHSSLPTTQSNQTTLKRDSLESLKKQIDQLSKFSFQQSQLINNLQTNLTRAEIITGNYSNNNKSFQNTNRLLSLGSRFHFLVDNYISQNERLNQLGDIEQLEKHNDANERAIQTEEICQIELGSNYTPEQLKGILEQNQEGTNIITRDADLILNDDLDTKLGQEVRTFFQEENDNDSIISNIKTLREFTETMKRDINLEDSNINNLIDNLKNRVIESDELRAKNVEILKTKENLEIQLEIAQQQLQEYSTRNNEDDKHISNIVKSFYLTRQNTADYPELVEKDLDLSNQVRNIFNEEENNDAIIRTIQSNKESADDNSRVAELSSKLQELSRNTDDTKSESEVIQNLNEKHQQELEEKDRQIAQLIGEIESLKSQSESQMSHIQNLNTTLENNLKELFETNQQKDKEITELKHNYLTQINQLKEEDERSRQNRDQKVSDAFDHNQSYEAKINELKELLSAKENEFNQLRNDFSEQQKLNEQKLKENVELRAIIDNADDVKNKEIFYLKQELLTHLEKIKDLQMALNNNCSEKVQLNEQIESKEDKLNQLRNEADQLRKTIEQKETEMTSYKERTERQLEGLKEELSKKQNEVDLYCSENSEQRSTIESKEREIDELKNSNENLIDQLRSENSEQRSTIECKLHEIEELKRIQEDEINQLKDDLSSKQDEVNQLRSENSEQRSRIESKERELEQLRQSHESEINKLREDLSSKEDAASQHRNESLEQRSAVESKDREIIEMKQKHELEINELKSTNSSQRSELDSKEREINNLKPAHEEQIMQFSKELSNKDSSIDHLRSENCSQKSTLDQKDREISHLKEELSIKEASSYENMRQKENEFNALKESYEHQIFQLKEELSKQRNENEIEEIKGSYLNQIESLKEEIANKEKAADQLTKENLSQRLIIEDKTQEMSEIKKSYENKMNELTDDLHKKDDLLDQYLRNHEEKENSLYPTPDQNREISSYNEAFANHVRALFSNHKESDACYSSLHDNDKEIIEIIRSSFKCDQIHNDDNKQLSFFESVTNLFHPDLSNDDLKVYSKKVSETAEQFFTDSNAKPALNHLFESASGDNLQTLVAQMINDPDESIRKNAEILSYALKDSRMSLEAEGMITTTLAMFLQEMSKDRIENFV